MRQAHADGYIASIGLYFGTRAFIMNQAMR